MTGEQRYFTLSPSRLLDGLFFALGAIVLTTLWSLPWHILWLFFLTVSLLGGIAYCWLSANLRLPNSCIVFKLMGQDEAELILRNGKRVPSSLFTDSLVTPFLVILNFKLSEQRTQRSVIVLPDAMNTDDFRRLRVALKWGDAVDQSAI